MRIFDLLLCHFVGDYLFQSDFIARTKGSNAWHMIVHASLYIVPFVYEMWWSWKIPILWASHFIIDTLKAKHGKITYKEDQILHLLVLLIFLIP